VLMIRLARVGARKQPYYRVVVIEKDRARNGRSVEVVGTYNPRTSPASVDLKSDRVSYWTGQGAQLSERVAKLVENYKPHVEGDPVPDKKTTRKHPSSVARTIKEPKVVAPVAAEPEVAEPEVAAPAEEAVAEPTAAA
jgi:small subunit ribosomal protein S16